MIIYFLFSYISSDFCFRYLVVYDVYLLCELYSLSLKIFIFVAFKRKKEYRKKEWKELKKVSGNSKTILNELMFEL